MNENRKQWVVVPWDADPYPEDVPEGTLAALQAHVDGYVECLRLDYGGGAVVDMWMDEEYLYKWSPEDGPPPINVIASTMAISLGMGDALGGGAILGNVVLADCDDEGNTVGLRPEVVERFLATVPQGIRTILGST